MGARRRGRSPREGKREHLSGEGNAGVLFVVGTPIGNLEDISARALRTLQEADVILAEDTRSASKLQAHFELPQKQVISFFAGNEARRSEQVMELLRAGQRLALISDAGMPGISDPGERLVARCVAEGVEVEVIPGPSAAVSALVLSGLPTGRFTFIGFLPRQQGRRRAVLEQLAFDPGTLIFYESPRRLIKTLGELSQQLGDRQAAIARELTKLHQEVLRGSLSELAQELSQRPPRGEITLVVAPPEADEGLPEEVLQQELRQRLQQGESPREIADALAVHGRRRIYQAALKLRDEVGST